YYLWDPDPLPGSGHIMDSILTVLGYSGDYGTGLAADLTMYQACLVATGVYPDRYLFSSGSAEAAQLVDFLQNDGGRVYMEGSATWYIDPYFFSGYDFRSVFGMTATAYSYMDMGPVVGETGTFTTGMNFAYGGQNAYMDHLNASGTGFLVFHDGDNGYNCGVANDASTYRSCGVSFELGGLTDASPPSTRSALLDSIMKFFGIIIPGVEEEGGLSTIPIKTMLSAMYPNPGIRVMSIRYQVAKTSDILLRLYDASGRLVRTLEQGMHEPGYYTMIWDTKDDAGRAVPAGIYFIRFETDDYQRIEKAILLR
ncbi:MAG: FlgD immunoglobulin-like domain containing protein, partial [bacterium]